MTSPPISFPSFGERYRVERELGRGGMATVYLCTDTKFGRQVAIKLLHPDLAAAVGAERFHREIRIATGLSHPGILPAFDSGQTDDGHLFYVMPFVEGESLRDRLEREQQLSVEDAVRITIQVASALQYAHGRGIVHRDIKPENILLQGTQAVVADFGIARAAASATEVEALTQTGVSIGTPTYMSPEQGMGERKIDGRSDQYSLACVTYEMLTGQPPFVASSLQMLVMKHVGEPVPLISTVRPSVPEELEDVILRALEKVPADRWPTVGEFGEALNGVVATTGTWARHTATRTAQMRATRGYRTTRATPGQMRTARLRWTIAAATLVAVLAFVGAWRWFRGAGVTDTTDFSRIAVLYFADLTPQGQLTYLADGLTESLIDRLSEVKDLRVISRDGVAPFRGGAASADSAGRALDAGTVVTGSVEQQGQLVEVNVQLRDGQSGAVVERGRFTVPVQQLASARDSIADETSQLLRKRVGQEMQLRRERNATSDLEAWSLMQRAASLHRTAEARVDSVPQEAAVLFDQVDSLLALAAARDARWTEPAIRRASLALRRAKLPRTPQAEQKRWIETGLAHAEDALSLAPRSSEALEMRGTLRYEKYVRQLAGNLAEEETLLRTAEEDLLQSTEIDGSNASAWSTLSNLAYRKLDLVQANLYARRALEADAYLANADEIHWRLFATSYDLGQSAQASRWCDEGRRRFPRTPRYAQCRLYIGLMDDQRPDPAEAWKSFGDFMALTPQARRPFAERQARMLAAGTLARAGLADSARSVLLGARAGREIDPQGSLLSTEALVRLRLGDKKEAMELLTRYLSEFPQHRAGMTRNTWWWKDLQNDPKFRALVH